MRNWTTIFRDVFRCREVEMGEWIVGILNDRILRIMEELACVVNNVNFYHVEYMWSGDGRILLSSIVLSNVGNAGASTISPCRFRGVIFLSFYSAFFVPPPDNLLFRRVWQSSGMPNMAHPTNQPTREPNFTKPWGCMPTMWLLCLDKIAQQIGLTSLPLKWTVCSRTFSSQTKPFHLILTRTTEFLA